MNKRVLTRVAAMQPRELRVSVDDVTTRKRNVSKLNQAGRRVMSHSEVLSRLTVGDRRSDIFRWALRKGTGEFERAWNYDGGWNPWQYNVRLTKPTSDNE